MWNRMFADPSASASDSCAISSKIPHGTSSFHFPPRSLRTIDHDHDQRLRLVQRWQNIQPFEEIWTPVVDSLPVPGTGVMGPPASSSSCAPETEKYSIFLKRILQIPEIWVFSKLFWGEQQAVVTLVAAACIFSKEPSRNIRMQRIFDTSQGAN